MSDKGCPVKSVWCLLLPVCAGAELSCHMRTLPLPGADNTGKTFLVSFPALGDAGGADGNSSLSLPLSCLGFCVAGVAVAQHDHDHGR